MASLVTQLRRIPTPLAVAVGVLVGLLLSGTFHSPDIPVTPWSGGVHGPVPHKSQTTRHPIPQPSLEQRSRVLHLLTTLSPHYTKECTRRMQPLYEEQAELRYAPLVGHKSPDTSSWMDAFGRFLGQQNIDLGEQMRRDLTASNHKYFFAINLYNSFDVIPDLFASLFRVASILGYHNVFVSIYENGSTDQTKALLRIFSALTRSVGLRVNIRTSARRRGTFNHRIEYLAEVRNEALVPLHELRESEGEYFDSIIFMNDVLPCVDDLLELIWQSRKNSAGITCASDYMFHDDIGAPVFYDNWVARDMNGTALENAPFERIFHHQPSSIRFQRHLPVQVQSCWNGIAVLDPEPFYNPPHIRFRMAHIAEGECSASECSLIANDYWASGNGRIIMVPRVKLAYDARVFDIIHPARRNLTAIRGYVRLGGLPENPSTDPQDRRWYGPHDRLFVEEESIALEFSNGPEYVWCWGWDGAGDLEGPDVDPIWERMPNQTLLPDTVAIKHDRGLFTVQ